MAKAKFYLGITHQGTLREVFKSETTPTRDSHGNLYACCIGPFRTKRGAEFMRDYGKGNPHCQTVADAEKLATKRQEG